MVWAFLEFVHFHMEVELVHQHVRKGGNIQVANGGANCNVDMCRAYIFDTEWETLRIFGPELFTTNTAGNGTPESRCFQKKGEGFCYRARVPSSPVPSSPSPGPSSPGRVPSSPGPKDAT